MGKTNQLEYRKQSFNQHSTKLNFSLVNLLCYATDLEKKKRERKKKFIQNKIK